MALSGQFCVHIRLGVRFFSVSSLAALVGWGGARAIGPGRMKRGFWGNFSGVG
jgi:hypothetical protein